MEDYLQQSRDEKFVQHSLHHHKFFMFKMQEDDDLLDHVNMNKVLADQLVCLKKPVRHEDIIMTLLKSLLALYEYLLTVMTTMLWRNLWLFT